MFILWKLWYCRRSWLKFGWLCMLANSFLFKNNLAYLMRKKLIYFKCSLFFPKIMVFEKWNRNFHKILISEIISLLKMSFWNWYLDQKSKSIIELFKSMIFQNNITHNFSFFFWILLNMQEKNVMNIKQEVSPCCKMADKVLLSVKTFSTKSSYFIKYNYWKVKLPLYMFLAYCQELFGKKKSGLW